MEVFLNTALSFPTLLFSILLCLAVLFWFTAALGLFDIDSLDLDLDMDIDMDAEGFQPEGLAGLLTKFGLDGVPLSILLSLLFLFSWLISYFVQMIIIDSLPLGWLRYPLGVAVGIGALFLSMPLSGVLCRPLRPLFRKLEAPSVRSILGQTAIVRSERVTLSHGEAVMSDGGAGLILKVRADEEDGFKRGDRVVLLEFLENEHAYRVVSENEFRDI